MAIILRAGSFRRICATISRFLRISFKSAFRLVDLFYFPLVSIIMWGLFSISWKNSPGMGEFIPIIFGFQIVYSFASQFQHSFCLLTLEDIWHGSLKQSVLLTPLSFLEYAVSKFAVAVFRAVCTLALVSAVAVFLFEYTTLLAHIPQFAVILVAALIGALAIGLGIDAIIILFGRDVVFFTWAALELFIMLACPFFSIDVFPAIVHPMIKATPFFWAFQAVKDVVIGGSVAPVVLAKALLVPAIYFVIAVPVYILAITIAKRNGRLAWS